MTVIELLTEKGLVQDVDYTFDGISLVPVEKSRTVNTIVEHEDGSTEIQESQETYTENIPQLDLLKGECVLRGDAAMVLEKYMEGRVKREADNINLQKFLEGDNSAWRMAAKRPTMDQLYQLIGSASELASQLQLNKECEDFLNKTDWKVLRHIRQKALGEALSLSEEEYLALEAERSIKANNIVR